MNRIVRRTLQTAVRTASPWSLGALNHVAIAVPDLDEATSFYRDVLKGDVTGKEDLPEHGVTTVFVNLPNTKIELLYPYGEKSPIAGFLAKNKKGGIHHICIEVDNIKAAMADCEAKGIRLLNKGNLIFFSRPASSTVASLNFIVYK